MENNTARNQMKKVGDLFDKYKNHFKPPQASVEKEASIIIKNTYNITIEVDKITYQPATQTLSLQIPSILKSELKRHFPEIINQLKNNLGDNNSPKVIL